MLFVCPSQYLKEITPDALDAHRAWLRTAVEAGQVVSAGRRDPLTGGVLILRAPDLASARAVLDADPFTLQGLASYDCIAYNPTMGVLEG